MWYTFTSEMSLCICLSLLIILVIVLIITSNLTVTMLVGICVGFVDMFLFALIPFWNLTLNPILLIHIVVSVGISVDYSAHIAYAYLVEPVPQDDDYDTPEKIRKYKATMALRKMGSSVFHGAFSTFLAILVLSPGQTYIFVTMFRLWFGIITFGISSGFIFLPVMLSFIGPTTSITIESEKPRKKKRSSTSKKNRNEAVVDIEDPAKEVKEEKKEVKVNDIDITLTVDREANQDSTAVV